MKPDWWPENEWWFEELKEEVKALRAEVERLKGTLRDAVRLVRGDQALVTEVARLRGVLEKIAGAHDSNKTFLDLVYDARQALSQQEDE